MQPEPSDTRYAMSGDVAIAYRVLGDGPLDLVVIPGFVSNVEVGWNVPGAAAFHRRLASFARVIFFDKRGTGLSDRVDPSTPLEVRMDDVRAVMDAAGSDAAVILGQSEGGPMSILFAATYPSRTLGLVVYSASASSVRKPDYPWAPTRAEWDEYIASRARAWATDTAADQALTALAPSRAGDPEFRRHFAALQRLSASPKAVADLGRMNAGIDVTHVLSSVRVPTLVVQRAADRSIDVEESRYIAERIPGAVLAVVPGVDHLPFAGDFEPIVAEIERFVAAVPQRADEPDTVLATVLFTDIVGSTATAAELGDRRWRDTLARHHEVVRRELARFRGREVDTAGDGFFATFDGPARAIRCARATAASVSELGLEMRAGLHTGECELIGDKVAGIAVSIGARVAARAAPGEVLVSQTVKDLVAGAEISFVDRGVAELKGVPGEWRLWAVEAA